MDDIFNYKIPVSANEYFRVFTVFLIIIQESKDKSNKIKPPQLL